MFEKNRTGRIVRMSECPNAWMDIGFGHSDVNFIVRNFGSDMVSPSVRPKHWFWPIGRTSSRPKKISDGRTHNFYVRSSPIDNSNQNTGPNTQKYISNTIPYTLARKIRAVWIKRSWTYSLQCCIWCWRWQLSLWLFSKVKWHRMTNWHRAFNINKNNSSHLCLGHPLKLIWIRQFGERDWILYRRKQNIYSQKYHNGQMSFQNWVRKWKGQKTKISKRKLFHINFE